MSVEFRRRSVGDILKVLKRHKWLITLPALAVFVAVAWVVRGLPNVYESTTLLTITPPKISEKVAPSLTDADLSQRLQAISQVVLSRSSLEPMVAKYGLFERERSGGMSMDQVIDELKNSIKVDPEKASDERIVGFRIKVRSSTPEIAQRLNAEIAEKYVTAQTAESRQSAETTREFINDQMSQARTNLDAIDRQRLDIMTRNIDTLPESAQGLIAQLEGLRQREQTFSKDKEALINERGRVQETIRSINSQMHLLDTFDDKGTVDQMSRIEDTPAYGELIKKRAELSARLENLKKQYREKHPDIMQAQTEIGKINEELEKLARNTDQRRKDASQTSARKSELQKRSLEIEREKAENQLTQLAQQVQKKDGDVLQNSEQIAALEAKINTIPSVKVALEGVDNQYQSAKSAYDDLVKTYNTAQQQVDRETNEQGETIMVVDPASLPQSPVNASKRLMFAGAGLAAGLGFGLFLVALFEGPRVLKLQSIEDAEHYTGMPVLAAIPPILSVQEIARRKRLRTIQVFAGVVVACVSVPVLIAAFRVSHIFERLS